MRHYLWLSCNEVKLLGVPGQTRSNNPDKFDNDSADVGDAKVEDNIECDKKVGSMVYVVGVAVLELCEVGNESQETSYYMPC